ncbi:metacaspase-like protein [Cryptosporidium canis]|uniref:Metacaspase-like protein n=1 Tax=Cryptosporidium canis TaxID=195482 RepID=A0A9D5HVV9_9CRYT|nr:metacaspase-like protein [Cryptosporidium canis]
MSGYIPKKKAVIIGINYIDTEGISLRGCANDAKLMALTLMSHFDFNASDIIFLTDSEPDRGYDTLVDSQEPTLFYDNWPRDEIPPVKHHDSRIYPNKRNILTAINWLTRDAEAGDILVFYFAGHGVQVDVLTSYEGEGYDEALLPADSTLYLASNGSDLDEYNVLLCSELKELLLCVPPETQLNVILDCNGGQTILDPAGNLNGMWYIKGVVTKGIWPFLSATNKVKRAHYNSSVFKDAQMAHRLVRPRYVPCVQVGNTQNLKDPSLQSTQYVSLSCKGYCFSAAPWSQIAAEASLPLLSVTRKTQVTESSIGQPPGAVSMMGLPYDSNPHSLGGAGSLSSTTESKLGVIEIPISRGGAYNIVHGVFTWSLCKAISDIATGILQQGRPRNELSFKTILARVREYISCLKASILPHLDQKPELTIHSGGAGTVSEYFCSPFGGDRSIHFDFDHYFRITDNCIRHLRANQNFLIPQEAYNSMLQANKNDNLVFHSSGSPLTFGEKDVRELENKNEEANRGNDGGAEPFKKAVPRPDALSQVPLSGTSQLPPSNRISMLDQGALAGPPSLGYEESDHLPASSVNLVPPTSSLFHRVSSNESLPNYSLNSADIENHHRLQDMNRFQVVPGPYFHTQNSTKGREGPKRVGENKAIGFNTFNPYSMFIGPEPSSSASRNADYSGRAPLEQNFGLKPSRSIMLSNPVKSITPRNASLFNQNSTDLPNNALIQSQSQLQSMHHLVGVNQIPMFPSQGISTTPLTPPTLSRGLNPPNQAPHLVAYPQIASMHSASQHLVAPIRSLPSSNSSYHQLAFPGHTPAPANNHFVAPDQLSEYIPMGHINLGVNEQFLQAPSTLHNNQFPPSNQSHSQLYPRSFISYPPPTQPMGRIGANM